MKIILVLCALVMAVTAFPNETYNVEFDNFDIKPLIEKPRVLRYYGKCFLDQGPCSPDGLEIKKALPEAMRTVCGKCTPKQRELVRSVIDAFKTKQPELWNELVQKMDPTGKYREAFKDFLAH